MGAGAWPSRPPSAGAGWRPFAVVLALAWGWALANVVLVYTVYGGQRTYRIQAAALIAAAVTAVSFAWPSRAARVLPMSVREAAAWAGLALAAWAAVVAPHMTLPFFSDDYVFAAYYGEGGDWRRPDFFRPLFAAVFSALWAVGDGSVVPFRLAAAGLHVLSALAVARLACRMSHRVDVGLVAFVVFLLNPLQLEVVLWPSGLQDGLWVALALAAMVVHVERRGPDLPRGGLVVLLVGLALLSKETAVCAVALLPLVDATVHGRAAVVRQWPLLAALVAVFAGYWLVRNAIVPLVPDFAAAPTRYRLTTLLTSPFQFFAMPWNADVLAVPMPLRLACAAWPMAALLALAWARLPLRRVIAAGAGLVVLAVLPVYSYFFVRDDLAAARYLYGPAAGWAVVVGALIAGAVPHVTLRRGAVLTLVAAASVALSANTVAWQAAGDLLRTIAAHPDAPVAAVADEWARRNGRDVRVVDGVPAEVLGVGVFLNGYAEFRALQSRPHRDRR